VTPAELELVIKGLREWVEWGTAKAGPGYLMPIGIKEVAALLDERDALTARIAELESANRAATLLLQTAYREWDEDKDHRVGKRISEVHAILSRPNVVKP
jgi:hypothetical protein